MAPTFTYDFSNAESGFKGKSSFSTGLFINGEFVDPVEAETIDLINPTDGKKIGVISGAGEKDVDKAVKAAQAAYETSWGLNVPGSQRARLLVKLADLVEKNADELAALESLNNGKAWSIARNADVKAVYETLRYYGGWADKIHGKTIEVNDKKFGYTRVEPIGVVGQIVPWNFPIQMMAWKIGPALATGNTIVFKASEFTPLTASRMAELIVEAGFPKGVFNLVTGFGIKSGAAIAKHPDIWKVAFTGSTLVGRSIMKAAADSNLKKVTLELGGKSPTIILPDADLDSAASWAAFGIAFNHGQCCCAGSRVYVHEDIYEKFLERFTGVMKKVKVGSPFAKDTFQGPQVSQQQFDRIMNYIGEGKKEGATVHLGGERHGTEGFFIQPTIFTEVTPNMTIAREEIFGPVVVMAKFKTDEEIIKTANDTMYGLAAAVFGRDITRTTKIAHALQAGTVWVNEYNLITYHMPFGGYKQSGIGRELGEYALENYTQTKAVHLNLGTPAPLAL